MTESITVSVKLGLCKVCSQTRTLKKNYTFSREKQLHEKFVHSLQTVTMGIKHAFVLITIKNKRNITKLSIQRLDSSFLSEKNEYFLYS